MYQMFCIAIGGDCNATKASTVKDKERGEGQKHGRGTLKDNMLSDKDENKQNKKRYHTPSHRPAADVSNRRTLVSLLSKASTGRNNESCAGS